MYIKLLLINVKLNLFGTIISVYTLQKSKSEKYDNWIQEKCCPMDGSLHAI